MTELDRLLGRAFGRPIRLLSPRIAIPALAVGLVIVSAAMVLLSAGVPRQTEPEAGVIAIADPWAKEAAAREDLIEKEIAAHERAAAASPKVPTTTPQPDFWELLYAFEATGPAYRSLADVGARSEAVVLGSFTGEVEPGREPCDEESLANGVPRAQACVFFANLPFRIDGILAGSLPEQDRETVKIEYMVRPQRQAVLPEAVPTGERVVLFIGSKGWRHLRHSGIQEVYYAVGVRKGTFRDVDGRVAPLDLPDDPEFGRLEGMPFEQFVVLVRRVPILDLMPEG